MNSSVDPSFSPIVASSAKQSAPTKSPLALGPSLSANPLSPVQPVKTSRAEQSSPKRKKVWWWLGVLLVLGGGVGVWYWQQRQTPPAALPISQELATAQIQQTTRPVTDADWSTVLSTGQTNTTIQALTPQFEMVLPDGDAQVPIFIQESRQENDQNLWQYQPYALQRSHLAFQVSGTMSGSSGETFPVELTLAKLTLVDPATKQAQTDLLVDGQWDHLILNESDTDAVHLSVLTQADQSSFLNFSLSDNALIWIDRLLHPDKVNQNAVIAVDGQKIYPYLDQYIQLPAEENSDTALQGELLAAQQAASSETIGQLSNYVQKVPEATLISNNTDIGLIFVTVDQDKLLKAYQTYWQKMSNFYQEHQAAYQALCQDKQSCWQRNGYLADQQLEQLQAALPVLLQAFTIEKTAVIVDAKTLAYRGLAAELQQKSNNFSLLKLPLQNATLTLSTYQLPQDTVQLFQPPLNAVLAAGASVDDGNELYALNRAYIKNLRQSVWAALLANSQQFCTQTWHPNFCIQQPSDFTAQDYGSSLSFVYPKNFVLDQPALYVNVSPLSQTDQLDCSFSETGDGVYYRQYQDFTTQAGLTLRIAYNQTTAQQVDGVLCMANQTGYSTRLPFASLVSFSATQLPTETILTQLQNLWQSVTIEGQQQPTPLPSVQTTISPIVSLTVSPSEVEYMERQLPTSISTVTVLENGQSIKQKQLVVNHADMNDPACYVSTQYVLETYLDAPTEKMSAVFPQGQTVCITADTCSICKNGVFEAQSSLEPCKGLRCNP